MELKELVPYLPYKTTLEIDGMKTSLHAIDFGVQMVNFGWGNAKEKDEFKVYLRPLSDLTKPCLEEGKTPIVELANEMGHGVKWNISKGGNFAEDQYGRLFEVSTGILSFYIDDNVVMDQLPLFNWLYEHHFWLGDQSRFGQDIIDINTL